MIPLFGENKILTSTIKLITNTIVGPVGICWPNELIIVPIIPERDPNSAANPTMIDK